MTEDKSRPDPDPTLLTTEQLLRSISSLREEARGWRDECKSWVEALQRLTEKEIGLRNTLYSEKFQSIQTQFKERDTRTEQTAAGVKIAVDAALQAAKEAVAEQNRSFALATGKSETATMKQIDALGLAIQTANKGLDDKIADMKDRLTRIEGMDLGSARHRDQQISERAEAHGSNQNIIAIVAAVIAALALVIGVINFSSRPAPVIYPQGSHV